jgi:predicted oxidoreductase (fatty acid repression mutant protein)
MLNNGDVIIIFRDSLNKKKFLEKRRTAAIVCKHKKCVGKTIIIKIMQSIVHQSPSHFPKKSSLETIMNK